MGQLSMNLVVIFIVIYCKEIAGNNWINLKYFREALAFSEESLGISCGIHCEKLVFDRTARHKSDFTEQVCNGYLDNCRAIVGSDNGSMQYCLSDDRSRMVWAENKQYGGAEYGTQPRQCVTPLYFPLRKKDDTHCEVCMCTCYHEREVLEERDLWKFSLIEQTSGDTKVVTGVRFRQIENIIYLQIRENELTSTDNGTWKPIDVDSSHEKSDETKYATLTHNLQTIKLDQIFTTEDSVITGVKFAKVQNPDKKTFSLELRIRSTKLNDARDELDTEHQDWHSGDPSTLTAGPKWWPDRGIRNIPMPKVSFNRTSLNKDFGMTTNPQLFGEPVGSCVQHDYPLKAIQLLLIELGGQEVIIPRISPAIIKGSSLPDYFDYDNDDETDSPDSANTASLPFFLIVMLPLLISNSLN